MQNTCILCGTNKFEFLFTLNKYKIVKCRNCALVFTSPMPSKNKLEKLYSNYDYKTGFEFESSIRKDAIRTLKNLNKIGINKGKILDVGCGAGFLLDEARNQNWNMYGIDTASYPIKYAKKMKLNVKQIDIESFENKYKFNVITLIQVIEHLVDPYPALSKINSLLEKDGILVISTPNISSLVSKILNDKFNYLVPPEHVFYYSPNTLKVLLEKSGFKVVKTITYGTPDDIGAIYRHLKSSKQSDVKVSLKNKKNKTISKKNESYDLSLIKKYKHKIFENYIRDLTLPLLDIMQMGSVVEVYAKKDKTYYSTQIYRKKEKYSGIIFLDRDGTLIERAGYLIDVNEIKILPKTINAIRLMNKMNIAVVIITNQPVVAHGMISFLEMQKINDYLISILNQKNANIDAIYSCPHHPGGNINSLSIKCLCRKPNELLLNSAWKEYGMQPALGIIGDSFRDIELGKKVNIPTVLIKANVNNKDENRATDADFICSNLLEGVKILLKFYESNN